jgi:hypothetical protein
MQYSILHVCVCVCVCLCVIITTRISNIVHDVCRGCGPEGLCCYGTSDHGPRLPLPGLSLARSLTRVRARSLFMKKRVRNRERQSCTLPGISLETEIEVRGWRGCPPSRARALSLSLSLPLSLSLSLSRARALSLSLSTGSDGAERRHRPACEAAPGF